MIKNKITFLASNSSGGSVGYNPTKKRHVMSACASEDDFWN